VFLAPVKGAGISPSPSIQQVLVSSGSETDQNNLLPLRTFVHEVLKRSRTSGSILQTALCYLEAVRPKVPEVLRDEKMGIRAYYQPESTILPATEAELEMDRQLSKSESAEPFIVSDDAMKTVRVEDHYPEDSDSMQEDDSSSLIVEAAISVVGAPSPSLPSPLLCPRRTFLAALILASKFSQDKCYSNRAWAKLSGLPPREIGRCERALGQALDWRLWVGKSAIASQTPTPAASTSTRTVGRSQSEGTISSPSSSRAPFMLPTTASLLPTEAAAVTPQTPIDALPVTSGLSKGLRRCATLPVSSFAPALSTPTSSAAIDPSGQSLRGLDYSMDTLETVEDRKEVYQVRYNVNVISSFVANLPVVVC